MRECYDRGMEKWDEETVAKIILDEAIALHRELGPGLLETVYEKALARALRQRELLVEQQVFIPIRFRGQTYSEGFRADLIVEGMVIVELKCVETMNPVFPKQLLTYLRLSNRRLGLLLNFGEARLCQGIRRVVNNL